MKKFIYFKPRQSKKYETDGVAFVKYQKQSFWTKKKKDNGKDNERYWYKCGNKDYKSPE